MNWKWFSPTQILFGQDAVAMSSRALNNVGKSALVVIGQGGSARRNGALNDVLSLLDKSEINWSIFDQVEPNPTLATVRNGARQAQNSGSDFIIGIGGGSALDAAKAIAILAINDLSNQGLFEAQFNKTLPIMAVPTTAGTGSEVTPYSILTYPEIESKKSIASPLIIPFLAAINPDYTKTASARITIDTAVDAFSHAFEGFISPKASIISDLLAGEALTILGKQLHNLAAGIEPDEKARYDLLYASTLAGMVISQTGTSIPHALGYSLTYFKDVTHGRANGIIIPAYTRYNLEHGNGKTERAMKTAGFKDLDALTSLFGVLCGLELMVTEEELIKFTGIAAQAKNISNNPVVPEEMDLLKIYQQSILLK
jgi:alcohol dehydrogenase class IV